MAGPFAQIQFAQWVKEDGGTHLDFDDLAAGTLLDNQYSSSGVAFTSISDPDGTVISKPAVIVAFEGSNEISGTPSGGSGPDGRVTYQIEFANPQKWAGLVRHGDNYYRTTKFYDPSGQLIDVFEDYAPTGGAVSRIFFGYLVESDDPGHWISRIECNGKLSDTFSRQVGHSDDLYFGTADVQESPPFKVTAATVAFDPTMGDRFTLKGLLNGFSLADGCRSFETPIATLQLQAANA